MKLRWYFLVPILAVAAATASFTITYAYDVPEVVDRTQDAARSMEVQSYRFGPIKDDIIEYSDGSAVPSRTFAIEMYNETANRWEVIGYTNTHIHKVKVDTTDDFDISVGQTTRINPKH